VIKILNRLDTGTRSLVGTSSTVILGKIFGIIKKIQIITSASTDVWIYSDASVEDEAVVDEDILGVTGTKITINTTLTVYPVVAQVIGSTNAVTDPDTTTGVIVNGTIKADWANSATDDTYRIIIWYESIV